MAAIMAANRLSEDKSQIPVVARLTQMQELVLVAGFASHVLPRALSPPWHSLVVVLICFLEIGRHS